MSPLVGKLKHLITVPVTIGIVLVLIGLALVTMWAFASLSVIVWTLKLLYSILSSVSTSPVTVQQPSSSSFKLYHTKYSPFFYAPKLVSGTQFILRYLIVGYLSLSLSIYFSLVSILFVPIALAHFLNNGLKLVWKKWLLAVVFLYHEQQQKYKPNNPLSIHNSLPLFVSEEEEEEEVEDMYDVKLKKKLLANSNLVPLVIAKLSKECDHVEEEVEYEAGEWSAQSNISTTSSITALAQQNTPSDKKLFVSTSRTRLKSQEAAYSTASPHLIPTPASPIYHEI